VNPCIGIGLTHPKELALHLLHGSLCQGGQHTEQCVREGGQRPGVIGTRAATRAGLPIKRAVLHVGHKRLLEMGE
jgi:hypothetical protein